MSGSLRAWEAGCRQSARLCVGRGARGVRAAEACTFLCHPWLCPSLRAQLINAFTSDLPRDRAIVPVPSTLKLIGRLGMHGLASAAAGEGSCGPGGRQADGGMHGSLLPPDPQSLPTAERLGFIYLFF